MKVKFKYAIRTYSGTLDEMTYGSYRNGAICIGRKWVYPELTAHNESLGAIMKNLGSVYRDTSGEYQDDLKEYAKRNGKQNVKWYQLPPSAYAIFIKMMFAWQESDPEHVDLETITVGDIVLADAPVISIASAVEADLLKRVTNYSELDNPMGE